MTLQRIDEPFGAFDGFSAILSWLAIQNPDARSPSTPPSGPVLWLRLENTGTRTVTYKIAVLQGDILVDETFVVGPGESRVEHPKVADRADIRGTAISG